MVLLGIQGQEGQQGPDSRPGFQCGCSGFTRSVEPTVFIIDPIKVPGSLFLGLLGENPGWVGGIEGRGGRVGMLLPKEFAEGALHRLVFFHAAAGLSVPEGRTFPPSPRPAPD